MLIGRFLPNTNYNDHNTVLYIFLSHKKYLNLGSCHTIELCMWKYRILPIETIDYYLNIEYRTFDYFQTKIFFASPWRIG